MEKGSKHSEKTKQLMAIARKRYSFSLRGKEITSKRGRVFIYLPDHPMATKDGYVRRSRLVMSKHLGRMLTKEEEVHHKDRNKGNDDIRNLKLLMKPKHTSLTSRTNWKNPIYVKKIKRTRKKYWTEEKKKERGEISRQSWTKRKKPLIEAQCKFCRKIIFVSERRYKKRKGKVYCSLSCSYLGRIKSGKWTKKENLDKLKREKI